jgi:hypothetical protein
VQRREASPDVVCGRRARHAHGHERERPPRDAVDHAESAPGQAGVDAEHTHEHTFRERVFDRLRHAGTSTTATRRAIALRRRP